MKIVLFGMGYYNYTDSIKYGLEKLGHSVLSIKNKDFKPDDKKFLLLRAKMIEYNPDVFINFCGNYYYNLIDYNFLSNIGGKKVLIFADAIKFVGKVEQNYKSYDKVVLFEPSDVNYLKEHYGLDALLSEVSVDANIYAGNNAFIEKEYDLSFVGVFTKERGKFFEEIAKFAYERNLKFVWYGKFWREKYFWQKLFGGEKFAFKYPYLSKFVQNTNIEPEDVALLYKRTKICINNHVARHQGMGYRTFEIMANGNFQLCDERIQAKDYGLIDGENIVFYRNVKECISKIEYYLKNEDSRELIARSGKIFVLRNYTTEKVIERLLNKI